MTVEIFDISDAAKMRAALAVRTRVFVGEQGVPPEEEIDEHDRTDRDAVHVLARDGTGHVVGAGRFYRSAPDTARVGRMAVAAAFRGAGVGTALLDALVAEARRRGLARVHLHAQTHARAFYRKAGFYDDGDELWDAGILHQPMSRELA